MLATGVVDIEPDLPNLRDAIRRGVNRHYPVCDGYERIGRRTSIENVYVCGDIVDEALNQIAVATAHAAIAATAIHNGL